jgi:mRNA interferase MazF
MVVSRLARRGDVFLVNLDPTRGREIRKRRPCVVVAPDELNEHLHTLIVAPLTTGGHSYPFRVPCRFHGKAGYVVVDQIRTVDEERLLRRLGQLAPATLARTLSVLQEMFAP